MAENKTVYLMKSITPKEGVLRNVHMRILDRECTIERTYPNAVFSYIKRDGSPNFMYTSYIQNITEEDGKLIIETNNTVYELEAIE